MADTGWLNPFTTNTIADGGDIDWANPNQATVLDGFGAYVGGGTRSYLLLLSNFGASLPADAVPDGIEARYYRKNYFDSGEVNDFKVQLHDNGTLIGNNKADIFTSYPYGGTAQYSNYGGAADLWGATISRALANASTFGIGISGTIDGDGYGWIDIVQIKIYYTIVASATDKFFLMF